MKKNVFMFSLAVVSLMMTSCVSKKELVACQEENKALQANYVDVKEQLAAANARATSLEQQMKQQSDEYDEGKLRQKPERAKQHDEAGSEQDGCLVGCPHIGKTPLIIFSYL